MTAASQTTAVVSGGNATSALDKRRSKWVASQRIATDAEGALTALDQQLAALATQSDADRAALKAAIEQQAELKKRLKTAAKLRERLRAGRKDARRVTKKAGRRARTDEAKFEKALLKDMLQKAKAADLSKHVGGAAGTATIAVAPAPQKRPNSNGRKRTDSPKPSTRRTAPSANGRTAAR